MTSLFNIGARAINRWACVCVCACVYMCVCVCIFVCVYKECIFVNIYREICVCVYIKYIYILHIIYIIYYIYYILYILYIIYIIYYILYILYIIIYIYNNKYFTCTLYSVQCTRSIYKDIRVLCIYRRSILILTRLYLLRKRELRYRINY